MHHCQYNYETVNMFYMKNDRLTYYCLLQANLQK
jgi:hypothetical protein